MLSCSCPKMSLAAQGLELALLVYNLVMLSQWHFELAAVWHISLAPCTMGSAKRIGSLHSLPENIRYGTFNSHSKLDHFHSLSKTRKTCIFNVYIYIYSICISTVPDFVFKTQLDFPIYRCKLLNSMPMTVKCLGANPGMPWLCSLQHRRVCSENCVPTGEIKSICLSDWWISDDWHDHSGYLWSHCSQK